LLKKEFFRAWKLFFPGKPGEDYDTIEQAAPEEREEILRQAEELSTGKKRGRRSKENEYVELYRKFKHTQKEYYSSLDDFIKKERLRIKKNTLSGRFNDIEEKAAGERGKEATLEQLDAYQKTLNCSEKLGG